MPLEYQDIEERFAKCHICSAELSTAEHIFYGNRCVFCCDKENKTGMIAYISRCIVDYRIHAEARRMIARLGKEEARMAMIGCVAFCGGMHLGDLDTTKKRVSLLREMKKYCRKV
ncbi:MAG: hypothetical protein WC301_07510 [Candidatus Omnitrophota bacterium]|jgi:hypothetical protein